MCSIYDHDTTLDFIGVLSSLIWSPICDGKLSAFYCRVAYWTASRFFNFTFYHKSREYPTAV